MKNRCCFTSLCFSIFLFTLNGFYESCNDESYFDSPKHFKNAVEEKVLKLSEGELLDLISGDDSSFSLIASWKFIMDSTSESTRHDRIEQFIGVLNSRICPVPAWWQDVVRSTRKNTANLPTFERPSQASCQISHREGFCLFAKQLINASNENQIEVRTKDSLFKIPKVEHSFPHDFNFVTEKDICTFSFYMIDSCFSYQIKAISASKKGVLWESWVWADGNVLIVDAPTKWHMTDFVVFESETLVVFGASGECIYVESFDLKSGKPIVKFSSLYSWLPDQIDDQTPID